MTEAEVEAKVKANTSTTTRFKVLLMDPRPPSKRNIEKVESWTTSRTRFTTSLTETELIFTIT